MALETVVFGKKTVSDLFKEIYDNSRNKDKQINSLIGELKPLIENIGDARLVGPMIKGYLGGGVKNDERLLKLAAIIQRMDGNGKGEASDFISPEELAKLLEQSEEIGKGVDGKNEK